MDKNDILKRIDELLTPQTAVSHEEKAYATTSLLSLVYGADSPQLASWTRHLDKLWGIKDGLGRVGHAHDIMRASVAQLSNLKREIDSGLTGNLRQQITGEVLTDLIQLSRTVLDEQGDKAKNVAAVLAAAAFEDTIRRMGKTFAGVIGQDDLPDVLKALKDAGVMQSPQVGIAQSYLSFRNHALHANWDNIQKESIHSVLGFVEQLLLKHFSG